MHLAVQLHLIRFHHLQRGRNEGGPYHREERTKEGLVTERRERRRALSQRGENEGGPCHREERTKEGRGSRTRAGGRRAESQRGRAPGQGKGLLLLLPSRSRAAYPGRHQSWSTSERRALSRHQRVRSTGGRPISSILTQHTDQASFRSIKGQRMSYTSRHHRSQRGH